MAKYNIKATVEEMLSSSNIGKALTTASTYRSKSVGEKKMFWEEVYLRLKVISLEEQLKTIKEKLEDIDDKKQS